MSGVDVAVIDEHEVVRDGLQTWLTDATTRVTCFPSQHDYLAWSPGTSRPGAVVTEIQEGGRAPDLDRLSMICERGACVVVYSRLTSHEVILASLDAGATSYLAKSEGRVHLVEAVRRAGAGEPYIGPLMAEALHRGNAVSRVTLSEREREVLIAWFRTDSKDEVGRVLHIAPATVRTHLQRIRSKYAQTGRPAATKSALFARALEDGLIGIGDLT